MIGVIDYGAGNLKSLSFALQAIDLDFFYIRDPRDIQDHVGLLIPGVGSFSSAVTRLRSNGLLDAIVSHASSGGKVTGICLGMQLLFDQSEEGGITKGLGLIPGRVVPSKSIEGARVNRIGWDKVQMDSVQGGSGDYFFAHSYEAVEVPSQDVIGVAHRENRRVVCAVRRDNIVGLQFHPEKSGRKGLLSLRWALGEL